MKQRPLTEPRPPHGCDWSIPSRLDAVDGVCGEARQLLETQGLSGHVFAVDLLLRECINNGILHAHASDPAKRVEARLSIGRRWILIRIADRGPGFNWRAVMRRAPNDAAASGRGLAIARLYASRVRFSRTGNAITMWIEKQSSDF
jgi:anti-sigma regulatory factor (Ser/Thr protein kinase)